jgi:hypothetical protein
MLVFKNKNLNICNGPKNWLKSDLKNIRTFLRAAVHTHFLFLLNLAMKHSKDLAALSKAPLQL